MWQGIVSGFLWASDMVLMNTVFINDINLAILPLIMATGLSKRFAPVSTYCHKGLTLYMFRR